MTLQARTEEYNHHYTKLTFVCDVRLCTWEREVTGSHLTRGKQFFFSSSLDLDVTRGSSLTQLAMANYVMPLERGYMEK